MPLPDLRPQLAASQDWVASLIAGVRPDQLDNPTPCSDYTVGELISHLLAVEDRVARLATHGNVEGLPSHIDLPEGDFADAFRERVAAASAAWADDSILSRTVNPPWGEVPGAAALGGYVQEHLTHGWDLAVATGQPSEADPALAEMSLQTAQRFVPAEPRGGFIPFGPVVESAADAGPTERLANWLGRASAA